MRVQKRYNSRLPILNSIVTSRFAFLKKRRARGEVGGGRDEVTRKKYATKKKKGKNRIIKKTVDEVRT